jgi:hypothetical protein
VAPTGRDIGSQLPERVLTSQFNAKIDRQFALAGLTLMIELPELGQGLRLSASVRQGRDCGWSGQTATT